MYVKFVRGNYATYVEGKATYDADGSIFFAKDKGVIYTGGVEYGLGEEVREILSETLGGYADISGGDTAWEQWLANPKIVAEKVAFSSNKFSGSVDNVAEALDELKDNIAAVGGEAKSYTLTDVTSTESNLPNNVLKRYRLRQTVNEVTTTVGDPVDILKDNSLLAAKLSTADATWNGTAIVDGTGADALVLVYQDANGQAQVVAISVGDFLRENEFKDGLNVNNNGEVSVKLSTNTESQKYLTLETISGSNAAIKVSGIDAAIATATQNLAISAAGDTYVNAAVDASNNKKINVSATQKTITSLGLADTALQGVDTTASGEKVKVTLGKSGKNVTVSVDETALNEALTDLGDDKTDKVSGATAGNFAGLDANGNLTDSGKKASDFATAAQGTKADTAIQNVTGETAISGGNSQFVAVTATKSGTNVTLASAVKVQSVETAGASAQGLAEASDVKSYVDDEIDALTEAVNQDLGDLTISVNGETSTFTGDPLTATVEVDGTKVKLNKAAAQANTLLNPTSGGKTAGEIKYGDYVTTSIQKLEAQLLWYEYDV